jgi:hypothetical protein
MGGRNSSAEGGADCTGVTESHRVDNREILKKGFTLFSSKGLDFSLAFESVLSRLVHFHDQSFA